MNFFDSSIINALHDFSGKSSLLTSALEVISSNDFINGGLIISVLWFFWFHPDDNLSYKRQKIAVVLTSTLVALLIGRVLINVLPFRMRPVLNPSLTRLYPDKLIISGLELETSMPSDHAVMLFALATGIFLVSKKIGVVAFLYVLLFNCFPRVYLGLHYPSDIVIGAIVGIVIQLLFSIRWIVKFFGQKVLLFYSKYPGLFFILFFCLSFEIGSMFKSSREIAHFLFVEILHLY